MTTILNALQSQGNANILSTPSVIALDNEEAFITVGQQVPFVTGSYTNTGSSNGVANPFQTIQRENVGVTLQVTPQINEGDSVVMDIVQEVSSISQQVLSASDVITNERKIETKVMAQDGDIVVLGGLVKDDIQGAHVLVSDPKLVPDLREFVNHNFGCGSLRCVEAAVDQLLVAIDVVLSDHEPAFLERWVSARGMTTKSDAASEPPTISSAIESIELYEAA